MKNLLLNLERAIEVIGTGNSDRLFNEYMKNGYLRLTPKEALNINDADILDFYLKVLKEKGAEFGNKARENLNSSYMVKCDFCFLNVRALSRHKDKPGTFIDALKILPILRVNAIHLAPFFDSAHGSIYSINSLKVISNHIIDKQLDKKGFSGVEQLKLFVNACHILGYKVGFDLEPHTAQFSRVVVMFPEYFRWIKLSKNKNNLYKNMSMSQQIEKSFQETLVNEIKDIVTSELNLEGVDTIEKESSDLNLKELYNRIISRLIKYGYWTIPSHTWAGAGLPEFKGYNKKGNYPEFEYLTPSGLNHNKHAFCILTPFKFYDGFPINKVPDRRPIFLNKTFDFFMENVFYILENYSFDFIRFDFVDHVFDSVKGKDYDWPISDRPTPGLLKRIIEKVRERFPYCGTMAERMGGDIELYSKIGFDLLLSDCANREMDIAFLKDEINKADMIRAFNMRRKSPVSLQFAIDTHDVENPLLFGESWAKRVKQSGMLLRFVLSRFLGAGLSRRPKYEVIGNQDMTDGLYRVNNFPESLDFKDDKEFNRLYHNFEDFYAQFRYFADEGFISERYFDENHAYFFVEKQIPVLEALAIFIYPAVKVEGYEEKEEYDTGLINEFYKLEHSNPENTEQESKTDKVSHEVEISPKIIKYKKPVYKRRENNISHFYLRIPDRFFYGRVIVHEYDVETNTLKQVTIRDRGIDIVNLCPDGFKIYIIRTY